MTDKLNGRFLRGDVPWNKGMVGVYKFPNRKSKGSLTEEHRKNISEANRGRKLSEEHCRKIGDAHRGEKCTFWKGGKTKLSKLIRAIVEYKNWRMEVFERDHFTCVSCQRSGGWDKEFQERVILNADHIKPLSVILDENNIESYEDAIGCEELWDISNGRTLCAECHRMTKTYGINMRYHNELRQA